MKKGLIFATTLALALGTAVAVSAHQAKAQKVEANSNVTVYCAIDPATLGTYTLKLNVQVGQGDWTNSVMTEVDDSTSYPGKKIYKGIFEEKWGGADTMQFQLLDGSTWKEQDEVISSWKTIDNFSGKLHVYGDTTHSWAAYTEPTVVKYNVEVHVNGAIRGNEQVAKGELPVKPTINYGESFSGWYDNAELEGEKITAITADTTVYGKVENVPTVTYTVDDSRVEFGESLNLYAFESETGNENAEWPGAAIENKTITVPEDAVIIINNGTLQTVDVQQSKVPNDTLRIYNSQDDKGHYYTDWLSQADEPEEAGYYIVGTESNWKFANSTKMNAGQNNNKAQLLGYEGKAGELFKVRAYGIEGGLDWYDWTGEGADEDANFVVGETARTLDIYINENNELWVQDHAEPGPGPSEDVPEEDGYYIVGTDTEFKYEGATKMAIPAEGEDKAELKEFTLGAGKAFKVRSYLDGTDTWYENWGKPAEYPLDDDGNYKNNGEEDLVLDIYLNKDGEVWVFEHGAPSPDVPSEPGYYVVSYKNGEWQPFAEATKMGAGNEENRAVLLDYQAEAGEKFYVRSYQIEGVAEYYNWYGEDHVDEDHNYVVGEEAAELDIYINNEGGLWVEAHSEPVPPTPSAYTMRISGSETEYTLVENPTNPDEVQTNEEELVFAVGQTVTFYLDGEALEVEPKEDNQLTKVYGVEGSLTFAQEYDGNLYLNKTSKKVWAGQFTPGVYLAGINGEWNLKLAMPTEKELEGDAYFANNVTLAAGAELKFIIAPEDGTEFEYRDADPTKVHTSTEVEYTVVEEGVGQGNLKVTNAGTYNLNYNPVSGWYSIEDTEYVPAVYTLQVGETNYELELNEGSEYKIKDHINVKLTAGEEVKVLKDGVDAEFARKKIGNNNLDENFKIIATVTEQVYVDLSAETVFAGGLDFGGYHILRNDEFIHMTKNDQASEGVIEYYSEMISFKKDDVVRFIDTTAIEGAGNANVFDIENIDKYSEPGFAVVEHRLVAQQNVDLSVYIKLSTSGDQVYFGNVDPDLAAAKQFADEFNEAIGGVCKWDKTTDLDKLGEEWQKQVTKFAALDKDVQDILKAATKESSINEIAEFVGKYEYVAAKYGAEVLGTGYNFLDRDLSQVHVMPYVTNDTFDSNNNTMIIVISAIAATTAIALGVLLVLKKRKHQ